MKFIGSGKYHKNKNVSDFLEYFELIGSNRPMFIDKLTSGYRISAHTSDENYVKKLVDELKKNVGLKVKYRKRSGYSALALMGAFDFIIPF